jgi:ankyrin repeat protein
MGLQWNDGSAISFAAHYGKPEVMKILLDRGARIEFLDGKMHPLAIAAQTENWKTFEAILDHPRYRALDDGTKRQISEQVNETPGWALGSSNAQFETREAKLALIGIKPRNKFAQIEEAIQSLRHTNVPANDKSAVIPNNVLAEQALVIAIERNCLDCIRLILDAGYKPAGDHEFERAANGGFLEVVQLLAERFPDRFAKCKHQLLLGATRNCRVDVVRWLLEKGAPATAVDLQGKSALQIAAASKRKIVSAELERLLRKATD